MKKYRVMFLVILVCAFCVKKNYADYDDFEDVKEHYIQILLKKWQENAPWLEQTGDTFNSIQNRRTKVTSDSAWKAAANALNEYYNNVYTKTQLKSTMSFTGEHWLVRFSHRIDTIKQCQVWILVSGVNGKIMSTYRDTIQIPKKSKWEIRNIERQKQESDRESRVNYYYKYLQKYDNVRMCPSILEYFLFDKVNSVHIQKMDSVYMRKDKNDTTVIYKYSFLTGNKNIDSVTAVKMALAVTGECYGSGMTPFMVRLMGDNKEHWMIYCFPTIPDNIELQKNCYNLRTMQYDRGERLNLSTGCPVVFMVLIARENGQILTVKNP